MLLFLTFLTSSFTLNLASTGCDVSQAYSTSTWSCLANSGLDFMISRAWFSYGAFDSSGVTNVNNARAGGIKYTDVYMFPCRGQSASSQMSSLISHLGSTPYGQIWLDIEVNPSAGCSWTQGSITSNCDFILELLSTGEALGQVIGIYSSYYEWGQVFFGESGACSQPAQNNTQLWYADWDGTQSFSDFTSFGGWTSPSIKQYRDTSPYCGVNADMDWYP